MLIFDGDYPMAYGALHLQRDLTRPIAEVRATAKDPAIVAMACLPEMRRGKIAAALVKVAQRIERPGNPLWGQASGEAAYAAAQGDLAYYRILAQRGEARLILSRGDLVDHMQTWSAVTDYAALPVGFILGMEGTDPVLWPEQVHQWWEDGLRVFSLTHYGVSTYAHGTGTPGGLLPQAPDLLRAMDNLGAILDLTHIADAAFWQAVDHFSGPLLASHQNCRALVPGERQFTDEQLQVVIGRGGVIGASMDTWMLYADGRLDWANTGDATRRSVFPREAVTLEHLADHIDHVCQLAGNAQHAAIGGDTDGQNGVDGAPGDVDTVADYQKLAVILEQRGYSDDDIADVMHRNWQRFYERWLPT